MLISDRYKLFTLGTRTTIASLFSKIYPSCKFSKENIFIYWTNQHPHPTHHVSLTSQRTRALNIFQQFDSDRGRFRVFNLSKTTRPNMAGHKFEFEYEARRQRALVRVRNVNPSLTKSRNCSSGSRRICICAHCFGSG